MNFTYNITFIVAPEMERRLLDYLHLELCPVVLKPEYHGMKPELKKIIEVGGDTSDPEYGLSLALSVTFESKERANLWNDNILLPALGSFQEKFGQDALFFITLLQNLPI